MIRHLWQIRPTVASADLTLQSFGNFFSEPKHFLIDRLETDTDLDNLRHLATMSSRISLQAPYTVASLPRPIDRSTGRYVVGDVYGGAPGSKKRKRAELAVGIDGEGINIYDVSPYYLLPRYELIIC